MTCSLSKCSEAHDAGAHCADLHRVHVVDDAISQRGAVSGPLSVDITVLFSYIRRYQLEAFTLRVSM